MTQYTNGSLSFDLIDTLYRDLPFDLTKSLAVVEDLGGGGDPEIPANAVVDRDGAYILDRDGAYIIADPTPRTS